VTLYPRAALALWLALLAGSAWWIARHTEFSNELTAFLPASSGRTGQLLVGQLRSGSGSRTLLIALEGGEPAQLAQASRTLAAALAADPRFVYVVNGAAESVRAARELLLRRRYLLSPAVGPGRFGEESLRRALEEDVAQLGSVAGLAFKSTLAADPTGELRAIAAASAQGAPASRYGVWFSGDGRRALLLAQTAASGMEAVRQQDAVEAVRRAFADLNVAGGMRLLLSGPGVFAAQTRAAIEHDMRWLTGLAGALVTLILVAVYRSAAAVALSLLPVFSGLLCGVAAVSLAFGTVHGITLAFGATLIGEAVDYPSYLFTQRRPGESVLAVLGRIWPTLRLAVLTTVFGSLTLLLSSLQGLSQLGVLSMTGVLAAGLVTRWVLPVLAPRDMAAPRALPFSLARAGLALRRAAWLAWLALAVALTFLAVRHASLWDDDLAHLSPLPQAARELEVQLRADLRAPDLRYLAVATGPDRDAALAASEQAEPALDGAVREGALEGYDLAARYLPSAAAQERRRAALPDPETLRVALMRAQRGLPFRAGAFAQFQRDVEAARRGPPLAPEELRGTGLDLKVQSLLLQDGGGWTALIPLRGVSDPERLRAILGRAPAGERALFLDLKAESDRLVGGYRAQALALAGLGAFAIAALLATGFRELRRALRVMLPVYAAIVVTAACFVALDGGLSLFHLVSLLLVLGVGLNYALFFERAESGSEEEKGTSLALSVCFLTTFAAFGCLAASRVPVLSAIGSTVALGCALSLLNAMILGGRAPEPRREPGPG
jgi:predicted exporter